MKKMYTNFLLLLLLMLAAIDLPAQITAVPDNYFVKNGTSGAAISFNVLRNDDPGACSGTPENISIQVTSAPKIGTAMVFNGMIRYMVTANKFGQDSLTYKITCSNDGSFSSAKVYINLVSQIPDFINEAECTVPSLPFKWDIELKGYTDEFVMYLSSPLVGDLDGDGSPEIVVFDDSGISVSTGMRVFNSDLTQKHHFNFTTTDGGTIVRAENGFGHPFALGDVDKDNKGEILVATGALDGYKLRCYSEDGTLKWVSNDGAGNEKSYFDAEWTFSKGSASPIIADIDGDGAVEIFVGERIFDGSTGRLLVTLPNGLTTFGRDYGRAFYLNGPAYMPVFADIDNDGKLEVIGGNTTYKVSLNRANPVLSTVTILAYVDQEDGFVSVADVDCDGILDVVVTHFIGGTTMYVWQGNTGEMIGTPQKPLASDGVSNGIRASRAFVGDINNDGRPEICFTYASMMAAYAFDPALNGGTGDFVALWSGKTTSDTSGATTMTMFDFNLDGEVELVYRDETHIRILDKDGNNVKDDDGIEAIFDCLSSTHTEYPVVVDLDGDGHAEIIVSGALPGEGRTNQVRLQVFGSKTAGMWAPARQVWNQHGYNPMWVNKDLSIPSNPMSPATVVGRRDGTSYKPYNSFLQQAGNLDMEGQSLNLSPDLEFELGKHNKIYEDTGADELKVTGYIINSGDMAFSGDFKLSLYAYNHTNSEYILTGTQVYSSQTLDINESKTLLLTISNYSAVKSTLPPASDYIWYLALNMEDDSPNAPVPFYNQQRECNSWNNMTNRLSYVSGQVILCQGESAILNIEPADAFDCYWFNPDGSPYPSTGNNKGDSKTVTKATGNYKEYFLIDVYQKGTNNKITSAPDSVFIYQAPDSLVWTGGFNNDWNDIRNWENPNDPSKEEIFSYIPRGCTNVHIASETALGVGITRFPNLKEGISTYGTGEIYADVRCNNITLSHGAEVLHSQELIYNKAYVQIEMLSNRWYCFAPPLRNFYSGDIYKTDPNPYQDGMFAYTRLFSKKEPQAGTYKEGSWGRTFRNPEQAFSVGESLGVWLDDLDPDENNHQALTLYYPKSDSEYYVYDDDGSIQDGPYPLVRTNSHRFIYEENINASKEVKLMVEATSAGKDIMVGNPFMAHLDFDKFYQANSTYIENRYRIIDLNYLYSTYYGPGSGLASTGNPVLTSSIAPMQAVIITPKQAFAAGTLKVTPDMVVSTPGATIRSANMSEKQNILKISISDDALRNRTSLIYDTLSNNSLSYDEQSDAYKYIHTGNKPAPSVYSLTEEGYYMDIKKVSDLNNKEIRLGISWDGTGPMALAVENLPDFSFEGNIYLIDKQENKELLLKTSSVYIYTFNKTTTDTFMDNRFSLRFVKTTTGIDENVDEANGLLHSVNAGTVRLWTANNSLIKDVEVYDLQGRMIIQRTNVNETEEEISLSRGLYLLRVTTDKESRTIKTIIK